MPLQKCCLVQIYRLEWSCLGVNVSSNEMVSTNKLLFLKWLPDPCCTNIGQCDCYALFQQLHYIFWWTPQRKHSWLSWHGNSRVHTVYFKQRCNIAWGCRCLFKFLSDFCFKFSLDALMLTPLVFSYSNFLLLIQQCLIIPQQRQRDREREKQCILYHLLKRSNKIYACLKEVERTGKGVLDNVVTTIPTGILGHLNCKCFNIS
jgi:hypothetical protein